MRLPTFRSLSELINLRPTLRIDYRVYDMRTSNTWGNSVFWTKLPSKVCIFGVRPVLGDVVISPSKSGRGLAYVITNIKTYSDPGDQHYVDVTLWGFADELPPKE